MRKILIVEFKSLRGISNCRIEMPLAPDVYAITGENGVGKSSVMMAVSPATMHKNTLSYKKNFTFFRSIDYDNDTYIRYQIDDKYELWKPIDGVWKLTDNNGQVGILGFMEGSIVRGTRFWNTTTRSLKKFENVDISDLIQADDFIIKYLSYILKGNYNFYKNLYRIDLNIAQQKYHYDGVPYFIYNSKDVITQFDMSTGECLMINLLHLLYNLLRKYPEKLPKLILIDEIELSLHPSAIRRLVSFMKQLATKNNMSVYFATHSIEIIRSLEPDNLFYLELASDNSINCNTGCYPAYITRDIYMPDGYDVVILVEDDLAKNIVDKVLQDTEIKGKRMLLVLPVGGYSNTLELHNNLLKERILNYKTHVISIIDGDAKEEANRQFIAKKKSGEWKDINKKDIMYLPIPSLEKYLKRRLFDKPDIKLKREIRDTFFMNSSSIDEFMDDYRKDIEIEQMKDLKKNGTIKQQCEYFPDGKALFNSITTFAEIKGLEKHKFRKDICELVIKYENFQLFRNELIASLNRYFEKA